MTGVMESLSMDYATGKPVITLVLNERREAVKVYEELKGCGKVSVEIKKHREKRSLDANAYFWVLCEKLAEKMDLTKEDVYRQKIRETGVFSDIPIPEEDVEIISQVWNTYGTGWVAERVDYAPNGCVLLRCYRGSSTYDTKQMSRLIDRVVEDCKEQGIETETPDEIERLKSLWKGV